MSNINQSHVHSTFFLALGPMIETMMQWKALIAFGGTTTLASTICYCLTFQQGLNRDESPRPKLILPIDIKGKTKNIIEFVVIDVSCDYDNNTKHSYFSGSTPFVMFAKASTFMKYKIQTLCIKSNVSVTQWVFRALK